MSSKRFFLIDGEITSRYFYISLQFSIKIKTIKQQLIKSEAKNKQTISKLEKQQTKERTQNTKIYQTWKNNDVFPLTQATLIKNEFMTLIYVRAIFEQALQKRMYALHCRNYNYIIVKKKSRNIIDIYEN